MGHLTRHPIKLKPEYENDTVAQAVKWLLELCDNHQGGGTIPINHFLLSLYDGARWAPDMQLLCRRIDDDAFEHVMTVVRGYAQRGKELHTYFVNGGKVFENIAEVVQLREPNGYIGDGEVLELFEYIEQLAHQYSGCTGSEAAKLIARARADGFFKRHESDPACRTRGQLWKDAEEIASRY